MADVQRIEDANRAFRALDYQYGGGACHDAVVGYLPRGLRMLGAYATSLVTQRLCVAVADLHNLAGWTSFDTGQVRVARTHFGQALELAKEATTMHWWPTSCTGQAGSISTTMSLTRL